MTEFNLVPSKYNADSDIMTMTITAKELTHQSGYPRGNEAIKTGKYSRAVWKFVSPVEIADNVVHSWEEYESIATRLAQTTANIQKSIGSVKQAASAGNTALSQAITSVESGNASIDATTSLLRQASATAASQELTGLLNYRIDSTLIYKNSRRREFSFTFPLMAYDNNLTEKRIYDAIRELQKLSCPEMDNNDNIKIRFPAVFHIRTNPSPLIKINHAALTAVQANWRTPFKRGLSMYTELVLTFQDIEPLYRRSFERGGIVRVS